MTSPNNTITSIITQTKKIQYNLEAILKIHQSHFSQLVQDLEHLIDRFNHAPPSPLAINAQHLRQILTSPLPAYLPVVGLLESDAPLQTQVIEEFNQSNFLNQVWQIPHPLQLYINLLILIYRTSLLHHLPILRQKHAQISSTLEEMAALESLSGHSTLIFNATKIWLQDWQHEGFSHKLYDQLIKQGLIVH